MTTIEICERISALTEEIRIARAQGIEFYPEYTAAEIGRARWRDENDGMAQGFTDRTGTKEPS